VDSAISPTLQHAFQNQLLSPSRGPPRTFVIAMTSLDSSVANVGFWVLAHVVRRNDQVVFLYPEPNWVAHHNKATEKDAVELSRRAEATLTQILTPVSQKMREHGVTTKLRILKGSPVDVISQYAAHCTAQLVLLVKPELRILHQLRQWSHGVFLNETQVPRLPAVRRDIVIGVTSGTLIFVYSWLAQHFIRCTRPGSSVLTCCSDGDFLHFVRVVKKLTDEHSKKLRGAVRRVIENRMFRQDINLAGYRHHLVTGKKSEAISQTCMDVSATLLALGQHSEDDTLHKLVRMPGKLPTEEAIIKAAPCPCLCIRSDGTQLVTATDEFE